MDRSFDLLRVGVIIRIYEVNEATGIGLSQDLRWGRTSSAGLDDVFLRSHAI